MADVRALCLEDCSAEAPAELRFMQCVALVGSRGGLAFDAEGQLCWERETRQRAAELWVSADDRLMLRRPEGGLDLPVTVSRLGRELLVPVGKPVILKHGDELMLAGRQLRLHIHGVAPTVHEPQPFVPPSAELGSAGLGRRVARAAAALALGTAVGASGVGLAEAAAPDQNSDVITVRNQPPDVAMPPQKPKKPNKPKKPAKPKKPSKPAKKPAKPKS